MTATSEGRVPAVELGPRDRDQPAGRIFALVLGQLLDELRRHEPAVLLGEDPEALHDYRVVLRRGRTLLRAGRRVYPREELELLRALTATLADATSPVRDLDVLLARFDGLSEGLSPELRDGAGELRSALQQRHSEARHRLLMLLRGDAQPVLVRRWQVLASVHRVGGGEPGPDALRPSGEVADDLVRHAMRSLRSGGRRRMASDDPAQWHEVRKQAKRLRYLVATFDGLYPPGAFAELLHELSRLQDAFGDLQDHVVQATLIEQAGVELGGRAALAAGALSDQLHRDAHRDLERCRRCLRRVLRKKVRRSVRDAVGRGA